MPNVLIVDDNAEILAVNSSYLSNEGFHVETADTGMKAIVCVNKHQYDCIVLDIMLPDIDGFSLCKAIRTTTDTPIIFLTCKDESEDKIMGLTIGGDDYMTKPHSLQELTARINVILRRGKPDRQSVALGDSVIDKENKMIHTPVRNIFLSQKEFELFLLLFENPNKRFSKLDLFEVLWPNGNDVGTVAVHILKLRRKLEGVAEYIGTIENHYKAGYFYVPPDAADRGG